jgi:NTP pyrophosphatase (non-canonical NTP hydrolase)
MNLNELTIEVHNNAKAHGWWDEERTFGEIIALIHGELSEALEEYRSGHGLNEVYYKDGKPEGIPVELADTIIRILDYCGKMNVEPMKHFEKMAYINLGDPFGDTITKLHARLSKAYILHSTDKDIGDYTLVTVISMIFKYCNGNGIDIEEAIRIKHEYNKTRPYKHGGKVI